MRFTLLGKSTFFAIFAFITEKLNIMKITAFLLILFIASTSFSQFEVNYNTIGSLKLGASVSEVSKLCGQPLTFEAGDFSVEFDITISGTPYHIWFQEDEGEDKVKTMKLNRVSIKDPKFKSKEGAKVGMTKAEVLNIYKDFYSFKMTRYMDPETFDYPSNKLMFIIDKKDNQAIFDFEDFSEFRILFLIVDNVVKEIQILDGFYI